MKIYFAGGLPYKTRQDNAFLKKAGIVKRLISYYIITKYRLYVDENLLSNLDL